MALELKNVSGNVVTSGRATVLLDQESDAELVLGSGTLNVLNVFSSGLVQTSSEFLGFATGDVTLMPTTSNGTRMIVGSTDIGTYNRTAEGFYVGLNQDASANLVQRVLRAVTYTHTDASDVALRSFTIGVNDSTSSTSTIGTVNIAAAPVGSRFIDNGSTVSGTNGNDYFFAVDPSGVNLAGGDGYDVLMVRQDRSRLDLTSTGFTSLAGIEEMRGTSAREDLYVDSANFAGLLKLDAGPNAAANNEALALLDREGARFDFSGKAIVNFDRILLGVGLTVVFDDRATALLASASSLKGDHIILTKGSFTPEERTKLTNAGFDAITDGSSTTGNVRPELSGLDGDRLGMLPGATRLIDQGAQFRLEDDGKLTKLDVTVVGPVPGVHSLGIDETGRVKRTESGTKVHVDGILIGTLAVSAGPHVTVTFTDDATIDRIEALVHAFQFKAGQQRILADTSVQVSVTDGDGLAGSSSVKIANAAIPTALSLGPASVAENAVSDTPVGTLATTDPDQTSGHTYTLLDDAGGRFALVGNRLVVKNGSLLDYETARGHEVKVRVTDADSLTLEKTLTIAVTDIDETVPKPPANPPAKPLVLTGTPGADILVGDGLDDRLTGLAGRDSLFGLAGNDRLSGGLGNDMLNGGSGRDGFVFDARLSKTNAANKRANLDRISDFSVADDTVHLAKGVFSKIAKRGVLKKAEFYTGSAAHDADDRIIYNKKTGALLYDPDGNGSHAAIQFATLPKNLKLTHHDFLVI